MTAPSLTFIRNTTGATVCYDLMRGERVLACLTLDELKAAVDSGMAMLFIARRELERHLHMTERISHPEEIKVVPTGDTAPAETE